MKKEDLPNDIEQLKKIILNKNQFIFELEETIQLLRRSKFSPTSESNHKQLSFFNELEDIIDSDDEKREEKEQICYERKKRGKRKPIADNLPRIEKNS